MIKKNYNIDIRYILKDACTYDCCYKYIKVLLKLHILILCYH